MAEEAQGEQPAVEGEDYRFRATVFRDGLFAGSTVLVSGGAGGIGSASAWLFGRLGGRIVISGRKREKLEKLAAMLREAGVEAIAESADIRDPDAVQRLFETVRARYGGLDVLINAAGGQFPQQAIDYTEKGWQAVVDTNLTGTWRMMQAAARSWRDSGRGGSIVNIVVVTTHGLHGVAHSVAARAGVIALTRSMAVEWAPLGVRVNAVAPGAIKTEGWQVYAPEVRARYAASNPMKRAGSAWEIAEACAYLSSPAAAFVTGGLHTVDGGGQHWGEVWTIPRPAYFET